MKDELYHYGILGMKWGVRRYQNPDGTLTPAGKARYREDGSKITLANMTDEEYEYNMKQLQREKAYNDLKRNADTSAGNSQGFTKNDAVKLGVGIAASAATVALTAALSDDAAAMAGKALAKKIVLASGTTAIATIAASYGAKVDTAGMTPSTATAPANDPAISAKVGAPTKPGTFTPEQEKKYGEFFRAEKGLTEDQKKLAKGMRKQGYDPDQIEKYFFHSAPSGLGWMIRLK